MKFLIWSNEHGAWWREKEAGYTPFKKDAGIYDQFQAQEILHHVNFHNPDNPHESVVFHEASDLRLGLSKAEAQIVRLLLDAYHNNGEMQFHNHTNGCVCEICVAFEAAGNCKADDFKSLEEKVGWGPQE